MKPALSIYSKIKGIVGIFRAMEKRLDKVSARNEIGMVLME